MEGDTQDKVCVGEARNFTLSEPHFPQICMCSSTQKLPKPILLDFIEALLQRHG